MKKSFLLILFLFCLILKPVFSDGGMVIYDPDLDGWRAQEEERQLCAIHYENGIQNMVLAVEVEEIKGEKAVWIFPVPAKPDKVLLDIVEEFPSFRGQELKSLKDDQAGDIFGIALASQVYTWPILILMSSIGMAAMDSKDNTVGSLYGRIEGVEVHEHIEKMGLTTELITAKEGDAFYDYLYSKDLQLPMYIENAFNEYVGKDYSFVVSWVSDINEFNKSSGYENGYYYGGYSNPSLGVFVSFPTEKIYFPLKPTSIYKEAEIPVLIYITGYVTPELYSDISDKTEIEYFFDEDYGVSEKSKTFFNKKEYFDNLKYTKIKITSPASKFTEDLWINNNVPIEVKSDEFIIENWLFFALIFFILVSCLSSLIAGFIVFQKDKPKLDKFALFGLSNFLTLIGFVGLAYFFRINERFAQAKNETKAGIKKVLKKNAIISGIIAAVLSLPIIILSLFSIFGSLNYFRPEFLIETLFWLIIWFFVLFVFIFVVLFNLVWGYYNNKKVMYFTIAFSFLFLILSFLLWIIFVII